MVTMQINVDDVSWPFAASHVETLRLGRRDS